jgi:hypothetical protein
MFLRLTQILSGDDRRQIWVQSSHIVAIYPDPKGNGCSLELTTSVNPEERLVHVAELADQIGQSIGPWRGFKPAPTEDE